MKKSIFLFFAAILCAMSVSAKVIYFKPNGNWAQANAAFYANVWGGSGVTNPVKFTPVATDPDVYEAEIGTNTSIIFLRHDPAKTVTSSNMWNCWNRMGDLPIPTDGKNCCTIKEDVWSKEETNASSSVTWSTYTPPTEVVIPDRYITGTIAGGWNANDVKMTYDEATETYSHTFTAVAAGELHQFKVTDGTWSKNWGGDAVSPAIEGVTKGSDGNVAFTLSVGGDVTITFKDSKIQLTTTGSFTPVETFDYYVVGSFNGWNTADAAYGMTKDGDVYKKEVTFAAAVQFKVCNGTWEAAWGANNLGDNQYKELEGTDNLKMKEEKTFTIIFNPAQNLLTFEGLTAEAVVTYDYYVIGTVNEWVLKDEAYGMTDENADGVYEKEVTLAIGTHGLKINNGKWDNANTFGHDQLSVAYEGVSRGSGEGDNNIVIELAEAKTVTVKLDKNTKKITLEGLTEKAPEPTFDYYIVGSFNGNDPKKAENGMTLDGEVYKATVTLAEGDNTLKVTDGTWENTWGANELGAAYDEVSNPNDYNNIKITLAAEAEKEITVIFDATAGKITFEGLTPYVAPLTYTVTVPAGTEKCYIAGNMNGWAFQEMEAVTGETNKFTITIVGAKETDAYKYACQADWAYAEVIEGGGNRTQWTALDEVTAWGKPAVVTYVLMGVNNDWTTGIALTQNPGNEDEYVLENQVIIKATDAVKVVTLTDGTATAWCGNVDEWSNAKYSADDQGNIVLEDGIYTFYFKKNDDKIYINQTGYARKVTSGNLGTICLPSNVPAGKASGATFYTLAGKDANGRIAFDEVNGELAAGVSYLFQATATEIVCFYGTESVLTPDEDGAMKGTFVNMTLTELTDIYYFAKNALWSCVDLTELIVPANCAYVDMGKVEPIAGAAPVGVRRITLGVNGQNTATGVDQVQGDEVPTKMIINGQLFILRGEKMYDAQGKLVK